MATIIGTIASDLLQGTSGQDFISDYLGGNDTLLGLNGNDVLYSQDTLASSSNILDGGSGNDSLSSYGGTNNLLIGGNGNDSLYSYNGNNATLRGGNGNDYLYTFQGSNTIDAGFGIDTVEGGGSDTLQGNYGSVSAGILLNVTDLTVGSGIVIGGQVNTFFSSIEAFNINGSQFDDTLLAGNGNDTINGGLGNDILNGQAGNNVLQGGAGDDQIISAGSGSLSGGNGNDFLVSRDGTFNISGGSGNDTIFMLNATGTVNGQSGIDLLGVNYFNFNSAISITYNQATLSGSFNAGNRTVNFTGIERLEAFGSLANDILTGTNSSDRFTGGAGLDTITGGGGADLFRFISLNAGIDTITDFNVAEDIIELTAAGSPVFPGVPELGVGEFAGLSVGSLSADLFTIGSSASTSSQRIIYQENTGGLFYDADGIGGQAQVQLAILTTGLSLTNDNFLVS
jgi:Ca2+-binding RTX toxin-like protein